jgi:glucokinase
MGSSPRAAIAAPVVGVDVGGTKILAVAGADRQPVVEAEVATAGADVVASIMSVVDQVVSAVGATGPAAIGVGLAGFISAAGVALQAPNVPSLIGVDLPGRLRERYGVAVTVDNDANCAALAAARLDAPGVDNLIAVTLGTGIGGGLIVDGMLVRGAHGFAGEPGHMIVDVDGPECPCGQRGCWEVYASGNGLARLARQAVAEGRAPGLLAAAGGDRNGVDARLVGRLLADGDPAAAAIFDEFAGWVAVGIVNLVNLLDPSVVILGGGLVREGEALLGRIRSQLATYPTFGGGRDVDVRASTVGHLAGAIGAAMAAGELSAGRS